MRSYLNQVEFEVDITDTVIQMTARALDVDELNEAQEKEVADGVRQSLQQLRELWSMESP